MTDTAPCIAEGEHIKTQRHLPASCPMSDDPIRSGEIAQQLARAATVTEQPTTHCNWCSVAISQESADVWLDAMDDAHCEKNGDDGHQPEPTVRDFWQDGPRYTQYLDTTITPDDSPVSLSLRAILAAYNVTSTGEPVTWSITIYRTYHAAGTNVPDSGWIELTEHSPFRSEDAAMTFAENHVEGLGDAWVPANDAEYAAKVEQVTAVQQATAAARDRLMIDKIATLLGTAETWDGAADFLDDIAQIIGRVRPSVGGTPDEFAAAFLDFTGHTVDAEFDQRD